jgi:hypothetical protein
VVRIRRPNRAWRATCRDSSHQTTTQFTAGEAVLVDTSLVGRVAVRETLTLRIGYAGTDFTSNIIRIVCEERLNFAVERPAAIVHVTG